MEIMIFIIGTVVVTFLIICFLKSLEYIGDRNLEWLIIPFAIFCLALAFILGNTTMQSFTKIKKPMVNCPPIENPFTPTTYGDL